MDGLHINIRVEVSRERYYNTAIGKAETHLEIPPELLGSIEWQDLIVNLLQAAKAYNEALLEAEALEEGDDDTDEAGE